MLAETIALVFGRDKEARLANARARSRVRTHKLSDFGMSEEETKRFKKYFEQHLHPLINNCEEQRLTLLKQYKGRAQKVLLVAFLLVLALIIIYFNYRQFLTANPVLVILFVAGPLIFLFNWASRPIREFNSGIKFLIFPKLVSYFGEDFEFYERPQWSLHGLSHFDVLPDYDDAATEDQINGRYKDVSFRLMEARLTRETRDSDGDRNKETVFDGFLVLLDFNKSFVGKTVVKKDGGLLGQWFKGRSSGMESVALEDPAFEKYFDVYSTDQIEARYLLTTSFMERLLLLKSVLGGNSISCSFYNRQLLMMVESKKNRFEAGSIFKPVTFEYETRTVVKELGEIFRIIDKLKLNDSTGL